MHAEPAATRPRAPAGPLVRGARRAGRLARGLCATAWWSLVWFVGLPVHARGERAAAWRRRVFRGWARSMLRAAAVRVEVVGAPPRGPCVLVANHVGYVDILVLAATVGCVFVSMHEVRRWPWIGFMAARLGTIFLDRSDKRALPAAVRAIEAALARGDVVALFPEGGNGDGRSVRPFWPSLLEAPARLGASVAWATLRYGVAPGDPPPSRSVCWFGEPIRAQAARFLALERVEARVTFGDGAVRGTDRKQLARELHGRVAARFEPME